MSNTRAAPDAAVLRPVRLTTRPDDAARDRARLPSEVNTNIKTLAWNSNIGYVVNRSPVIFEKEEVSETVEGRRGTGWRTLRNTYVRGAVLLLMVIVLMVECYLVYRWYERYYGTSAVTGATNATPQELGTTGPAAPPGTEGASSDRRGGAVAMVHRATPETIVDNSTYVDHSLSNGNPEAVLLVTQVGGPDRPAGTSRKGVWYDGTRDRWAIFNQDLTPMTEGAVFNMIIAEGPDGDTFVHRAAPTNTGAESTYVDHPAANAAPDAVLSVTPNWNPGGRGGTYNDHPVGVWYDADQERWTIRNEDLAPIPDLAAFNVTVLRDDTF